MKRTHAPLNLYNYCFHGSAKSLLPRAHVQGERQTVIVVVIIVVINIINHQISKYGHLGKWSMLVTCTYIAMHLVYAVQAFS